MMGKHSDERAAALELERRQVADAEVQVLWAIRDLDLLERHCPDVAMTPGGSGDQLVCLAALSLPTQTVPLA
jgi:hypothetical protein